MGYIPTARTKQSIWQARMMDGWMVSHPHFPTHPGRSQAKIARRKQSRACTHDPHVQRGKKTTTGCGTKKANPQPPPRRTHDHPSTPSLGHQQPGHGAKATSAAAPPLLPAWQACAHPSAPQPPPGGSAHAPQVLRAPTRNKAREGDTFLSCP